MSVTAAPVSSEVQAHIRGQQIRLLYEHGVAAIPINVVVAVLLIAAIWRSVPTRNVMLWAGVFVAIRAAGALLYLARTRVTLSDAAWLRLFALAAFGSGAAWGLSALLLFPDSLPERFLVGVTVMAMTAGAAASISCVPGMYELYLFPAILPLGLRFAFENVAFPAPVVVLVILYCVGMIVAARTNRRSLMTAIRLRYENTELVARLAELASHDPLTGLPNRRMFSDRLASAIRRAKRTPTPIAVVFVDCDDFKGINDTYGHAAGDEFLVEVAHALNATIRESDTAARVGGDEFLVMLDNYGTSASLEHIIDRIRAQTLQPVRIGEASIIPRLSFGVACYPADGLDEDLLIRKADQAMYQAKHLGGNRVQFSSVG